MNPTNMRCPDCGSGRRSDGYHREGWYWLECDRRYNPETDTFSPENNWCKLKQRDAERETMKEELEALKPAWVCEFCFACLLDGDLPNDWDLVWQSAICPSCQKNFDRPKLNSDKIKPLKDDYYGQFASYKCTESTNTTNKAVNAILKKLDMLEVE